MKKFLLAIFSFLLIGSLCTENALAQRKRSSSRRTTPAATQQSVRQKQRKNKQEIQKTAKDIEKNKREIENKLNALNRVTAEIGELDVSISREQSEITALDNRIKGVADSITELDNRLSSLSAKYGSAVRRISTRNRNATSNLAFIFSANTVGEAYRRARSLKQFSTYRQRKATEINKLKEILSARQKSLDELKTRRAAKLSTLASARTELDSRREQNKALVSALQKEGKTLRVVMERKQKEAAALDAELNSLIQLEQERLERERKEKERLEAERLEKERVERERIAEQQRIENERKQKEAQEIEAAKQNDKKKKASEDKNKNKAKDRNKKGKDDKKADRKHNAAPVKVTEKPVSQKKEPAPARKQLPSVKSGDFAQLRGNLPSPVKGKYSIVKRFGRQKHPDLKYVETDNPGVDIETAPNAAAVAVADGYVSDIFRLPGYNNIIMVRHGSYLTVYANLGTISVKKGDKVSRGTVLGTVFSDPEDNGRSILHFEIRNEKAKENPEIWLALTTPALYEYWT